MVPEKIAQRLPPDQDDPILEHGKGAGQLRCLLPSQDHHRAAPGLFLPELFRQKKDRFQGAAVAGAVIKTRLAQQAVDRCRVMGIDLAAGQDQGQIRFGNNGFPVLFLGLDPVEQVRGGWFLPRLDGVLPLVEIAELEHQIADGIDAVVSGIGDITIMPDYFDNFFRHVQSVHAGKWVPWFYGRGLLFFQV